MYKGAAFASVLMVAALQSASAGQAEASLGGVWSLNRSLSQVPREIGFNVPWLPTSGGQNQNSGAGGGARGGRGRRGGGGGSGGSSGGAVSVPRESYVDASRIQLLTSEARNPPVRVTIVDTPNAVTFTNELGQTRTVHPTGREESFDIEGIPFSVTSRREADRLVVLYAAEPGRDVRYTYSRSAAPAQLIVEVQFLDHGSGDKARLVYEPGIRTETVAPPPTDRPASGSVPGSVPGAAPASAVPASGQPRETFDERPGAELRGLRQVGILIEDLGSQAKACGLDHDALETALAKRLTDGGFTVRRNSDEDTYLYANVITSTSSTGMCTSRFDAFLYTHATAKLSYTEQPVLVSVSLMHRGGIGTSAPATHASAVVRELEGYVDLFVTQIRNANK